MTDTINKIKSQKYGIRFSLDGFNYKIIDYRGSFGSPDVIAINIDTGAELKLAIKTYDNRVIYRNHTISSLIEKLNS